MVTDATSRIDAYQQWRARMAAKQEARRTALTEEPPAPAPNPMWDTARLFESPDAAGGAERKAERVSASTTEPVDRTVDASPPDRVDLTAGAIDLRTPPPPPSTPVIGRPLATSRRRALVATYTRKRPPTGADPAVPAPPRRSVGDALRELNDQRLAGTISEDEFKARKAELFA